MRIIVIAAVAVIALLAVVVADNWSGPRPASVPTATMTTVPPETTPEPAAAPQPVAATPVPDNTPVTTTPSVPTQSAPEEHAEAGLRSAADHRSQRYLHSRRDDGQHAE